MKNNWTLVNIFGSKARVKIIRLLAKECELNISRIIDKTKLNHKIVSKHLNILKNLGLIQEKIFGRIKIFRYKIENLRAKSLKTFIEIWEGDF